jgi:restriction system protein
MKPWRIYQEDAAIYFRSLGLSATTDATIRGARTSHDIDVLVTFEHVGVEIKWLVECKHWNSRVSKLHVMALREIVSDVGADRGILLSESGYQCGAYEAAALTNIQLSSIAELKASTAAKINSARLVDLLDRVARAKVRYWDIPKDERIRVGLRFEYDEHDYSGARVVELCLDLLTRACSGVYPFQSETIAPFTQFGREKYFESSSEVILVVEEKLSDLEKRLDAYRPDDR